MVGTGFERRRQETVERLALAYAHGHLATDSLEHRLEVALAAPAPATLDATLWGLPDAHHAWSALSIEDVLLPGTDERAVWIVGRSRSCDLRVSEPTVSARHARLACRGGRWTVADLGSTNGTWLNGSLIEHAVLRPGDTLALGGLRARLTT